MAATGTATFASLLHPPNRTVLEIIILYINYTNIIRINNNTIINNYYGRLLELIELLKVPLSTRKDFFSKFLDNLGTRLQKCSPVPNYGFFAE